MFSMTRTITTLAFGLFVVSSAVAAEHTYPGAMCVKTTGTATNLGTAKIDEKAQLSNSSTASDLTVVCPVVGPFNDTSGLAPIAEVFVSDRHLTEDICCSARANTVGVVFFGNTACSRATDVTYQTLQMTAPIVGGSLTSRYFHCTLPETFQGQANGIRLYRY